MERRQWRAEVCLIRLPLRDGWMGACFAVRKCYRERAGLAPALLQAMESHHLPLTYVILPGDLAFDYGVLAGFGLELLADLLQNLVAAGLVAGRAGACDLLGNVGQQHSLDFHVVALGVLHDLVALGAAAFLHPVRAQELLAHAGLRSEER